MGGALVIVRQGARHSSYLAAAMAVVLLASPSRTDDPIPKSRGSGLGGGLPFELMIRGDRSRFGHFDADGNFIPESTHDSFPPGGPRGGPYSFRFTNHIQGPGPIGEHRSGRLIIGSMVKGVFVPEIGSKILDISKEFDVKKPDRIVYNLWETVPAFWTEERKKQFPNGLPKDPVPPPAGTPAGWKLLPLWEATPGKRDLWHVRVIGNVAEFGHLDNTGEFIPDYGLPIVSRDGLLGTVKFHPAGVPRYYTLPLLHGPKNESEQVYEFRSGRLIKGALHSSGNFVPELGSKVMDFKDYEPDLPRRIYNLPGTLKKLDK